ncbi:hypothetical protein [Nitrosopumilus piranensis]|uniref:Nitrosopumilus output domain-containing protein n=1 Tax=Nitrosopumilus piranensis TaxID=1582439 RepID=A0A0C5C147_9ARCH|nr:hypothetical protein [Nitrosopumilus piranensis]AJM93035.1 hypothetical protein NPIRD3C_1825 [Nitrosopumilus piranensis]
MNQRSNHKQMLEKTTDDWYDGDQTDSFWNAYRTISYKFKGDDTINTVELTRFQYENFKTLPVVEYCKIEVSRPKIFGPSLMGAGTS